LNPNRISSACIKRKTNTCTHYQTLREWSLSVVAHVMRYNMQLDLRKSGILVKIVKALFFSCDHLWENPPHEIFVKIKLDACFPLVGDSALCSWSLYKHKIRRNTIASCYVLPNFHGFPNLYAQLLW
jgi:hypothetical protein